MIIIVAEYIHNPIFLARVKEEIPEISLSEN